MSAPNVQDWRTLPAGRELDALVAERVMGLRVEWNEHTPCPECGSTMHFCGERSRCTSCNEWRYSPYREYSDDIAAAWEVVEKLLDAPGVFGVHPGVNHEGGYGCHVVRDQAAGGDVTLTECESAADAICRAALAAVEVSA